MIKGIIIIFLIILTVLNIFDKENEFIYPLEWAIVIILSIIMIGMVVISLKEGI
ncbi:MAG: hypothetical protein LBU10_01190 [Endomicrobium sp.]|jgi:hypothetical protein|nr:hypothetical protein [Endomicrobium sp.]